MNKEKIYFPNLNGLRFIASFLVIIHHTEQLKSNFSIDSYWGQIPFFYIIGKLGVILFFVLSGFLITYLLLAEEKKFKRVGIRKFYIRRILRIWPLYFLIVFLAFVVLPNIQMFIIPGYGPNVTYSNVIYKVALYVLFLPNLVLSIYGVVPYVTNMWSVGTEEQYYLVWPLLLASFKKNRIALMIGVILFYLGVKFILSSSYFIDIPFKSEFRSFWNLFPIDCMAIGGLYSVFLFQKRSILKYLVRNDLFYFSIVLVVLLMISGVYIPYFHYEFYSLFFGLIILNFAANKNIKISLENKVLDYLGSISYGLYVYHPIGIVLALSLCMYYKVDTNWVIYPLSLIFTITMAGVSFKYFEAFFLKFKGRFSNIISGRVN